jgi:hypothetical protein
MNEDYEVRYWSQKWSGSLEQLAGALRQVGSHVGCCSTPSWQGTVAERLADFAAAGRHVKGHAIALCGAALHRVLRLPALAQPAWGEHR